MYHPQIMRAVHVWVDQDKDGEGVDEQGGSHPVQLPPLYRTVPGYCTVQYDVCGAAIVYIVLLYDILIQ